MNRQVLGWIILLVGIALYLSLQVAPLLGDRGKGVPGFASHANDYKHIYLGSTLLNEGINPYPPENMITMAGAYSQTEDPRFRTILPYVYLPFTGMVLTPYSWLPFYKSVIAFQITNHLLFLGGLLLLAWASGLWHDRKEMLVPGILLLAAALCHPLYRQNNAGQLNVILFFGMALLYTAIVRKWHNASIGAIAAFLMLFKISPGLFLIWFLLRKEWSRAAWMVGFAGLFTIITVALYGIPMHLAFLPVLSDMGFGKSTWSFNHSFWRDPYNQSINALFHKVLVLREGSGVTPLLQLSHGIANALTWVCALSILSVFSWRVYTTRNQEDQLPISFSLAVLTALLAPSILWDHYLTQAFLPLVLLWAVAPISKANLLVILSVVAIFNLPIPLDSEPFRSGPLLLLMNAKLYPLLALFAWTVYQSTRDLDSEVQHGG